MTAMSTHHRLTEPRPLGSERAQSKLLIVAYQFPPLGGVGPQRALSLCRYLPEYGFEVHVLTPRNGVSHTYDPTLLNRIPSCVQVHRTITPEIPYKLRTTLWNLLKSSPRTGIQGRSIPPAAPGFANLVQKAFFPDPQRAWALTAVRAGVRMIRKHAIGTVLVTAPPFSSLLIGVELKRRCPGIRLISDFRDEWLEFYIGDVSAGTSSTARSQAGNAQSRIVRESDVVVAVTPSSLERIRAHSPSEPESKFAYIPNGYDTELTPSGLGTQNSRQGAAVLASPRLPQEKLVVTYLGTVYKPNSPAAYLDALDRLPEEIRSRFETRFIGRIDPDMDGIFQNRRSSIRLLDFMPQAEALRYLVDSDYVLAAMLNGQTVVAKIYEYLAANRPILAVTPSRGEVARLIRETRAGWSAAPDHPESVESMLRSAYAAWLERRPFQPDRIAIKRYDRRQLAGEFAEIMLRGEGSVI
ncbi:MAG TPA: glycosyltransferase [Candidatus Acidoferrales bacterium]|jgi:glycosyltransferase involved in cell wall biosynthesis|nr:glycosyltransferase [Candidatus Acidoferrales bacterium]